MATHYITFASKRIRVNNIRFIHVEIKPTRGADQFLYKSFRSTGDRIAETDSGEYYWRPAGSKQWERC
jgi:hypothetical protein